MTVIEEIRRESSNRSLGVATDWAKPDNVWVEMAWTVLEAANDLSDEAAVEACQRVIDDGSNVTGMSSHVFGNQRARA